MLTVSTSNDVLGEKSGTLLKPITSKNLRKLRKAINGTLVLQGFSPVQLDMLGNYAKSITDNRTWWFRFNQLPTLEWTSGIWAEDRSLSNYIKFNFSIVKNWENHTSQLLPLKWHDHASAIRTKNLADWYLTVALHSSDHEAQLQYLANLIETHLEWLCQDKNYSRLTNHGFEQARIMIYVASELPGLPSSEMSLKLGLRRLEDEIRFAFTEQGVHKENSPGYQWFMIKIMQETKEMLDSYNLEIPRVDFRRTLNKAKRFLNAIALPDNSLPLIGDTQDKQKQNSYVERIRKNISKSDDHQAYNCNEGLLFDYSDSGYLIHTAKLLGEQCKTIFKNAHFSDYHKHNDDLSLHITMGSSTLFGDAGLYSHNQKDTYRRYTQSSWSHTTTFPKSMASRKTRLKDLVKQPSLFSLTSNDNTLTELIMIGLSSYYGPDTSISRTISIENLDNHLKYLVTDQITTVNPSIKNDVMISNFLLGENVKIEKTELEAGFIQLTLKSFFIDIFFPKHIKCVYFRDSVKTESLSELAFISRKAGELTATKRIEFEWPTEAQKVEFSVILRGR